MSDQSADVRFERWRAHAARARARGPLAHVRQGRGARDWGSVGSARQRHAHFDLRFKARPPSKPSVRGGFPCRPHDHDPERPRKNSCATMRARAFSAIRIALISLLMSSMN